MEESGPSVACLNPVAALGVCSDHELLPPYSGAVATLAKLIGGSDRALLRKGSYGCMASC